MAYFVTGATGFIGRFLVAELVEHRDGPVFVLCRRSSMERMQLLIDGWGSDRVTAVVGDLTEPDLGVGMEFIEQHAGTIDHFFHLAAVYDMSASDELNQTMNVDGTRHAVQLAARLRAERFHQISSVAAAGEYQGRFDETMFDEGQSLPSPYHRTKFESEKIVRDEAAMPWRVYRPAIVLGHSETGEMDKIDGPYYFFGAIKRMRDLMPGWMPLVGVDLGDTNMVPVDYVARSIDRLAHLPGHDREAFHLVNPTPQSTIGAVNLFCAAAGAPRFADPLKPVMSLLPERLRPASVIASLVKSAPVQAGLDQTLGRLGIPPEVLAHTGFTATFDATRTQAALADTDVRLPELDEYASQLWSYWEDNLDTSTARDAATRKALRGKHVIVTGASSGIGRVTALKVAQAGGIPVLIARGREKLEDLARTIELRGGTAHVYPCDLSDLDEIDQLAKRLTEELPSVDFLVNNAGRSIRRSLRLSHDRFHDFERTMQLNYFGAIRLIIGLMPTMQKQKSGHVVNISSVGVQTNPPRFSAYVASKAALDAWSRVVSSEVFANGVSFTNIHMPLVRTPMIAPTTLYDRFPTISPAQAADLVITAMVDKPHEINTATGNLGAIAHTLAPKAAFRVLNAAYFVFPDSAAAKGDAAPDRTGLMPTPSGQRISIDQDILARVFKGVHW